MLNCVLWVSVAKSAKSTRYLGEVCPDATTCVTVTVKAASTCAPSSVARAARAGCDVSDSQKQSWTHFVLHAGEC